jgi:hypothetical protein
VHVFASYLDPTDKNLPGRMPGDLRGIDTSGKEALLLTYGMMVVELEGDAGEKLQVAPGKKATLKMAIPSALQASAPTSIPLWYFSDSTGKWMEQGSAARQGNNYVGQVGHFSWWNCDIPIGTINFKVYVKDQHGNPLAYTWLQFTSSVYGIRGGYTDANGYASGLIPKGQTLRLEVINSCGTWIGGANVGPALSDQDLGTLTVTDDRFPLILSGTVVDCSNAAVDSGYVSIQVDGYGYRTNVTKGAFALTVQRCSSNPTQISLMAGNYKTSEYGSTVTMSADTGKLNVGQLPACGMTVTGYISVTINGVTYKMTTPPDSMYYQNVYNNYPSYWWANFMSFDSTSRNMIGWDMVDTLTGPGTYQGSYVAVIQGSKNYTSSSNQTIITDFGPINGFISGTVTATVQDSATNTSYPLTGTFKVRRIN